MRAVTLSEPEGWLSYCCLASTNGYINLPMYIPIILINFYEVLENQDMSLELESK